MKHIQINSFLKITMLTTIFIVFGFLFNLNIAFAAPAGNLSNVQIITNKNTLSVNDFTVVEINANSNGEIINGIEGEFVYDANLLTPEKIQIGDSFINLWVEKPSVTNPGHITFSGIIPGGIVLNNNNIFSIIFRANKNGQDTLTIKNLKLLINDGSGTALDASVINTDINITGTVLGTKTSIDLRDYVKPNKFTVNRTKNDSLFENKWFIVFNTQDKESGIDHYLVCEGIRSECVNAVSPYLLNKQSIFYYIKVIAVDGSGNKQSAIAFSKIYYLIFVGLILLLSVFYIKYLKKNK
jgi:hypothetical protein